MRVKQRSDSLPCTTLVAQPYKDTPDVFMKNTDSITVRYADSICGSLSCFDRLILQGTLTSGRTSRRHDPPFLYQKQIRIFDFPGFSKPITGKIRANNRFHCPERQHPHYLCPQTQ
jgi:hypothetical protein